MKFSTLILCAVGSAYLSTASASCCRRGKSGGNGLSEQEKLAEQTPAEALAAQ